MLSGKKHAYVYRLHFVNYYVCMCVLNVCLCVWVFVFFFIHIFLLRLNKFREMYTTEVL